MRSSESLLALSRGLEMPKQEVISLTALRSVLRVRPDLLPVAHAAIRALREREIADPRGAFDGLEPVVRTTLRVRYALDAYLMTEEVRSDLGYVGPRSIAR